jgi:ACT domain-containing protein
MTRRILTAEDVAAMEAGTRLVVDDATTVTGAARDLARRKNVVLVEDGEATGALDTATDGTGSPTDNTTIDVVSQVLAGPPGRIIVTAVGVNRPGILSEVTAAIGQLNGDIVDVSQLINAGYFNAILLVDIAPSGQNFTAFRDALQALSKPADYVVTIIDERVFDAMHRL